MYLFRNKLKYDVPRCSSSYSTFKQKGKIKMKEIIRKETLFIYFHN